MPDRRAPRLLTRMELAEAFAVHSMTITKWEREGLLPIERGSRGRPSRYALPAVLRWYVQRELRAHGVDNGAALDPLHERGLLDRQRRAALEFDLSVKRGAFIAIHDAERVMSACVKEASNAFLGLHAKLAGRHPELPRQVILDLDGEVRQVLADLAERAAPLLDHQEEHRHADDEGSTRPDREENPEALGAAGANGTGPPGGRAASPRPSAAGGVRVGAGPALAGARGV